MKTILRIIALIIVLTVVGFVLAYVARAPKIGQKPTPGATPTSPSASSTVPVEIQVIKEQASSTFSVSVEYPQFPTLSQAFNDSVKSAVLDRLAGFRKDAADNYAARKATATPGEKISPSDFSFIARWEPAQINNRYVSFIVRFDSYTGGANELQELQTFDYDVANGRAMGIGDLFGTSTSYLSQLSNISRQQLVAHMKDVGGADAPTDLVAAGTEPTTGNFANFTFTDYLLTIYFPKYSVAAGSFGEQTVTIPLKDIR